MRSRRDSPLRTCILPSFQDFCEGLSPSAQESLSSFRGPHDHHIHEQGSTKSTPSTPTNSLVILASSYRCPYSHCDVEAHAFARWEDCINHMQEHHAELVNELLRGSMLRVAADSASQTAIKHGTYTAPRPVRGGSEQNVESVSRPEPIGWFDPTTKRAQAAFKSVEHLTDDERYSTLFKINSSRPLYGDQPVSKKASSAKDLAVHEQVELHHKQRQSKPTHKVNERARRDNHAGLMSELHFRTPELAHLLGEEDEQLCSWKRAGTSKGPGKYDQLFSDLYMHDLSAIVAQSEHNGRKAAERRVQKLERRVQELERQLHKMHSSVGISQVSQYRDGSLSPSKKRRTLDVNERSNADWKGKSLLLPPSPSPSVASSRPRLW